LVQPFYSELVLYPNIGTTFAKTTVTPQKHLMAFNNIAPMSSRFADPLPIEPIIGSGSFIYTKI
jgi:hypothetical protein